MGFTCAPIFNRLVSPQIMLVSPQIMFCLARIKAAFSGIQIRHSPYSMSCIGSMYYSITFSAHIRQIVPPIESICYIMQTLISVIKPSLTFHGPRVFSFFKKLSTAYVLASDPFFRKLDTLI
jgi:hypothetical protein